MFQLMAKIAGGVSRLGVTGTSSRRSWNAAILGSVID